jgi:hypothetical protein
MQRLAGRDAVFLYRETSTSLMHTLKALLLSKALSIGDGTTEVQLNLVAKALGLG